jgi:hypothetical protein
MEEFMKKYDVLMNFVCITFTIFSFSLLYLLPLPTYTSIVIYSTYFIVQFLFARFLPGKIGKSIPLENGTVLTYRVNGLLAYFLTFFLFFLIPFRIFMFYAGGYLNLFKLTLVYDNLFPLISTTNYAVWLLYIVVLFKGINSTEKFPFDSYVRQFWFGIEQHPRYLTFKLQNF